MNERKKHFAPFSVSLNKERQASRSQTAKIAAQSSHKKILQYVGIAAKAGKVFGGEMQTESRIKSGSAKLLILAEDASAGTRKKLVGLAERYGIPYIYVPDREALGRAAGKDLRSSLVICDEGLARAIEKTSKEAACAADTDVRAE